MPTFTGTSANDTLTGTPLDDTINALGGADVFLGLGGTDLFEGGTGNDTILAGLSSGTFRGGAGNDVIEVSLGNATVEGGWGRDALRGGSSDDVIDGGEGQDTLSGGFGADALFGGGSGDLIYGDAGDDTIFAGDGYDTVWGDQDNDSILGWTGYDELYGGAGDDTIKGGTGRDLINGGHGQDRLEGEIGRDTILGGEGSDLIDGGDDHDSLWGGGGDDSVSGGLGADQLLGDSGNDLLDGGYGHDTLDGGSGNDTIDGGRDNDVIDGRSGEDHILGGAGADLIDGGSGHDFIDAEEGADSVTGGHGFDTIFGGRGADLLSGGALDDSLDGGRENDTLAGGSGRDTLIGGRGADDLTGDAGDDHLEGGAGHDQLSGGDGNDTLDGGDNNDIIVGGSGDDVLTAGLGRDFVRGGGGNDTIYGTDGGNVLYGDAGDDLIIGGDRREFIYLGAGNDEIQAGGGADQIHYTVSENFGFSNVIDGGAGSDTLVFTCRYIDFYNPVFFAEIADFQRHITFNNEIPFTFESLDLTVSNVRFAAFTLIDHRPEAVDDLIALDEDTQATGNVLGNDTDADGDSLTASLVSGPDHGALVLGVDGHFVYIPEADFVGTDSFVYAASDPSGATMHAQVTLDVAPVNDAPVAVDDVYVPPETENEIFQVTSAPDDTISQKPVMAQLADGNFVVVWQEAPNAQSNQMQIMARIYAPDGTNVIAPFTIDEDATGRPSQPDVTATSDGGFAVTYLSGSETLLHRFDEAGNETGSAQVVSGDAGPEYAETPKIVELADGALLVTWYRVQSGNGDAVGQIFNVDGSARGGTFVVNAATVDAFGLEIRTTHAGIDAAPDGGFYAVWREGNGLGFDIGFGRFDELGQALGETSFPLEGLSFFPEVAHLANGRIVVTWDDLRINASFEQVWVMRAAVLEPDGTVLTGPFDVVGDPQTYHVLPIALADPDGGFLLAWSSYDTDAATKTIVARSYDADGQAIGGAEVIATHAFENLRFEALSGVALAGGRYALAWNDQVLLGGDVRMALLEHAADGVGEDSVETILSETLLINDKDIDGDSLSIASVSALSAEGAQVSLRSGDVLYDPTEAAGLQALAAGETRVDTFTYTISDGQGGSDTATVMLTVLGVNDAPTAMNDAATTTDGDTVVINAVLNDTDIDGDSLQIIEVTQGANGSVTLVSGLLRYEPEPGFVGTDSFTYIVADPFGATAEGRVDVLVERGNEDPVAVDDTVTTLEDTAILIPVLSNDSDPEGAALSINALTDPTFSDAQVDIVAEGILYTPETGFVGTDAFAYQVADGEGGFDTASVFVTVTPNLAPVAVDDVFFGDEDTQIKGNLFANDSDPEGDALVLAGLSGLPGLQVTGNGDFTYTPGPDENGSVSFTYSAVDTNGHLSNQAQVTLTIAPVNDAPVAVDDFLDKPDFPAGDAERWIWFDDGTFLTFATDGGELTVQRRDAFGGAVEQAVIDVAADLGLDGFRTEHIAALSDGRFAVVLASGFNSVTTVRILDDDLVPTGIGSPTLINNDLSLVFDPLFLETDNGRGVLVRGSTQSDFEIDVIDLDTGAVLTQHSVDLGIETLVSARLDGDTLTLLPTNSLSATVDAPDDVSQLIRIDLQTGAQSTIDLTVPNGIDWAEDTQVLYLSNGNTAVLSFAFDAASIQFQYAAAGWIFDPSGAEVATFPTRESPANALYSVYMDAAELPNGNIAALFLEVIEDAGSVVNAWSAQILSPTGDSVTEPQPILQGPGLLRISLPSAAADAALGLGGGFIVSGFDGTSYLFDAAGQMIQPDLTTEDELRVIDFADLLRNDYDVDLKDSFEIQSVDATSSLGAEVRIEAGQIIYDPTAAGAVQALDTGEIGRDSFRYTIQDKDGLTDTAVATLEVLGLTDNDLPLAEDDAFTLDEDTTFAANVLGNDTDPDGDTLSVTLESDVTHGNLTLSSDGSFSYTPDPEFSGSDGFTYAISDGRGGTAQASVSLSVTPVNDVPFALGDQASTLEDQAVSIAVLSNDGDLESAISIAAFDQGAFGSVTQQGDVLIYTPDADAFGADSFTYTITDVEGAIATAQVLVEVTPVNDAPDAVADTISVQENGSITFDPIANDTDVDGDLLRLLEYTQPANGTVRVNLDGSLTYTPDPEYSGADGFTYFVSDSNGGISEGDVFVDVTPTPPAGANDDRINALVEDGYVIFDVRDNDTGANLAVTPDTLPATGRLLQNADGTFIYVPDVDATASDGFIYQLTDGETKDTAAVELVIKAINDAPRVEAPLAMLGQTRLPITFSAQSETAIVVSDVDAAALDPIRVTVIAENGRFELAAPIIGVAITGEGTNTITLEGNAAAVTQSMDGMTLTSDGTLTRVDVLTEDLGHSGSGGNLSAAQVIVLTDGFINGTTGDDPKLNGGAQTDFIRGLAGDDVIAGVGGNDFLFGQDGNDTIRTGQSDLPVDLAAGTRDFVDGGRGDDQIIVTADTTVGLVRGGDGADTIELRSQVFQGEIDGGAGANDRLVTSLNPVDLTGADIYGIESTRLGAELTVKAQQVHDLGSLEVTSSETLTLVGGGVASFQDMAIESFGGGFVALTIAIEDAGTVVSLGDASNPGFGATHRLVMGSQFDDVILGGTGLVQTELNGNVGNDLITGGAASESIQGGEGADTLNGGDGQDTIFGDEDNDILSGGADEDMFVFTWSDGTDRITDFEDGVDLIRLDWLEYGTQAGEASFRTAQDDPGSTELVINGDAGTPWEVLAIIENVAISALDASDVFVFELT